MHGDGVKVAQKLRELPWGQRAIRVYDPDGHIIDSGALHRLAKRAQRVPGDPSRPAIRRGP